MNQNDIANMIDWVAQAVASEATSGAMAWGEFSESERSDFRKIAVVAMAAHDAWLTMQKYKIVPPGMLAPPVDRNEAAAMVQIGAAYLEKHPGSVVMPPRPRLQIN